MTDTALSVTLSGDNSKLQETLDQSTKGIEDFKTGILKMAVGFGSIAGAADMLAEKIVEMGKSFIDFIPDSIKSTDSLAETFRGLNITAGMSIGDFNAWNATIELSGGKAEDLTSIVQGMERGIKQHSEFLIANGIAADQAGLSQMKLGDYIGAVVDRMNTLGNASDKDRLLMEAFGRGGMQFAAMLVKLNENQKEGQEIAATGGAIIAENLRLQAELENATGRYNLALQQNASSLQSLFGRTAVDVMKAKTDLITFGNETDRIIDLIDRKLIEGDYSIDQFGNKNVENYDKSRVAMEAYYSGLAHDSAVEASRARQAATRDNPEKPLVDPEKEKAARKAREEADRRAKAERDRAEEETRRSYNALVDEGTQLTRKGLEIDVATTAEGKKQSAMAKAKNDYEDSMAKIKATRGTSKDSDINMQANIDEGAAANVRRLAERKAQQDFDAATLADANKLADAKSAGQIAHDKADLATTMEGLDKQREARQISGAEYIRMATAINNAVYQEEVKALNDKKVRYAQDPVELQKINNQIQALTDANGKRLNEIRQKGDSDWVKEAKQMQSQVENETARSLTAIITEHEKAGKALKEAWASVSASVINDLMLMGIKKLEQVAIDALVSKEALSSAATTAAGTAAANTAATASTNELAAAEIWAAYAYIPFAGAALAEAEITAMLASETVAGAAGKITALATGGMITSPTMGLIGETGEPELVAPKEDFMSVTRSLVASGASMYGAIVASQARSNGYNAASYMPSRGQMVDHPGGGGFTQIIQGHVIGEGVQSANVLGRLSKASLDQYNRRRG